MILGHGIDIVEISRFAHWHTYSLKQLSKVFTTQEIRYCLSEPVKSAERFAARFAAKEAAYKALCQIGSPFNVSFLSFCKMLEIKLGRTGPAIHFLDTRFPAYSIYLSISHSKENAISSVIIMPQ